jgi:hypothetical protein
MPTSTLPRRNSAADGCTKLTLCERQPNKRLQPTRLSSNVSNDQRRSGDLEFRALPTGKLASHYDGPIGLYISADIFRKRSFHAPSRSIWFNRCMGG